MLLAFEPLLPEEFTVGAQAPPGCPGGIVGVPIAASMSSRYFSLPDLIQAAIWRSAGGMSFIWRST